jgi:hypothetical protein
MRNKADSCLKWAKKNCLTGSTISCKNDDVNSAINHIQRLAAFVQFLHLRVRQGNARLRKNSSGIILMLAFAVSIGEPLICMVHCSIWLPWFYHSTSMAAHQHMHMPGMVMPDDDNAPQLLASEPAQVSMAAARIGFNAQHGTSVPVPALPIHEISIGVIVIALLTLVLCSERYRWLSFLEPLTFTPPIRLRPPIMAA